jgi:hypothetical protein
VWEVPIDQLESDIEYLAVSPDDSFIVAVRQASLARWDFTPRHHCCPGVISLFLI